MIEIEIQPPSAGPRTRHHPDLALFVQSSELGGGANSQRPRQARQSYPFRSPDRKKVACRTAQVFRVISFDGFGYAARSQSGSAAEHWNRKNLPPPRVPRPLNSRNFSTPLRPLLVRLSLRQERQADPALRRLLAASSRRARKRGERRRTGHRFPLPRPPPFSALPNAQGRRGGPDAPRHHGQ
jgi:hypothetical protein